MIDPLADKLLISAAFISLVQMDLAPAWMVAVIIGREFAVTALRSLAYARGVAMPASPLGKIKMVSQVVAILAADPRRRSSLPQLLRARPGRAVGGGGHGARLGVDYFRRFNHVLSRVSVARFADADAGPQGGYSAALEPEAR